MVTDARQDGCRQLGATMQTRRSSAPAQAQNNELPEEASNTSAAKRALANRVAGRLCTGRRQRGENRPWQTSAERYAGREPDREGTAVIGAINRALEARRNVRASHDPDLSRSAQELLAAS